MAKKTNRPKSRSKKRNKAREGETPPPSEPTIEGARSKDSKSSSMLGVNWKLVDWFVRMGLVLIMAVVFIGILLQLLIPDEDYPTDSSPSQPAVGHPDSLGPTEGGEVAPELFLSDFMKGDWTLGQSKWQLRTEELARVPDETTFADPPTQLRRHDPEFNDDTFIDIFKTFGATREIDGALSYWRFSAFGAEGSMFTSLSDEGEIVQLLRFSFPTGSGISFVEGRPSDYAIEGASSHVLMPLYEGVEQLAIRSNQHGIVSSAVLNQHVEDSVLVTFWRSKGWKVVPVYRAGSANEQYRCEKGSVLVVATFMKNQFQNTVLLVRVPSPDPDELP